MRRDGERASTDSEVEEEGGERERMNSNSLRASTSVSLRVPYLFSRTKSDSEVEKEGGK